MNIDGLDKECEKLCDALNSIPGIVTCSSCCGHGEYPYRIWMYASQHYGLNILGWSANQYRCNAIWNLYFCLDDPNREEKTRSAYCLESTTIGYAAYKDSDVLADTIYTALKYEGIVNDCNNFAR